MVTELIVTIAPPVIDAYGVVATIIALPYLPLLPFFMLAAIYSDDIRRLSAW